MALAELVRSDSIDVVVAESLDRIARDLEDIAWFGKQLRIRPVKAAA